MNNFINTVGFFGPFILFLTSSWILRKKNIYFFTYIFGFLLSVVINYILKITIKQPRPSENQDLFNILITNGKNIEFEKYGMPSGHAQSVFYSTIYIYLITKDIKILMFYLLISLITIFQRIINKRHTIFQVIIGLLIGVFLGYLLHYVGENKIKGVLKLKLDDNGPI
jgi:membrane-associated phospholipid phosphatase